MMRINPLSKFSIVISFTTLLSQSLVAQTYCAAKGNNPWQQWMARVEFNGIDNVSAKEGLELGSNQLTGSIPNFNLPLLGNLFLHNNRFTGNIPAFNLPKANPILLKLDWVQSADSVAHFEVQKLKTDGTGFETIHQAIAQDGDNYYMGYDDLPVEGANNYRLKTVLKNGKTGYSPIQKVDYQQLVSFTVFPNPASDETFLSLKDFVDKTVECRILDISGKALFHQTIEKANILPHRLNTASLKAGTYFIEIQCVGKRTVTRKLFIL